MFTKLQEVLLCLAAIKNVLEPGIRTVKRYIADDELKYTLLNYLLIQVAAFLDEWRKLEGLVPVDPILKRTLDAAHPAVKRIRRWKDIKYVRNKLLAHSLRDGEGLSMVESMLASKNFPMTYAEQLLVAECAVYAVAVVLAIHKEEAQLAMETYCNMSHPKIKASGIRSQEEFVKEIDEVRRAIVAKEPWLEKDFGCCPSWPT